MVFDNPPLPSVASVGAGAASVLNAISDALGDEIFRRAPVTADIILASLEAGHAAGDPLTAHI